MSLDVADLSQVVGAAAAVIQAVVVVIAAIYALGQVRESKKSRSADIALHLFERLHNRSASERRRTLYQEIPAAYPTLTYEQDRIVQDVISDFYMVGYLVEEKLLDFELVAGLYYGSVIRTWQVTEQYIMHERSRRGTAYAHYFESLYRRCREYQLARRPTDDPTIYLKAAETEGETPIKES
jgi:hypothetical protein